MPSEPPATIGDLLHQCYANLAMAHSAVDRGSQRYTALNYGIRKRLLTGLRAGSMNIGSLADDERIKMNAPTACCYCGTTGKLTLDHLMPKYRGGEDSGDNIVWACRSCNSSKGSKDLMQWMSERGEFPPLLLLRRYLKLAIRICETRGIMDAQLDAGPDDLPFGLTHVPTKFPSPAGLVLWRMPDDADP